MELIFKWLGISSLMVLDLEQQIELELGKVQSGPAEVFGP